MRINISNCLKCGAQLQEGKCPECGYDISGERFLSVGKGKLSVTGTVQKPAAEKIKPKAAKTYRIDLSAPGLGIDDLLGAIKDYFGTDQSEVTEAQVDAFYQQLEFYPWDKEKVRNLIKGTESVPKSVKEKPKSPLFCNTDISNPSVLQSLLKGYDQMSESTREMIEALGIPGLSNEEGPKPVRKQPKVTEDSEIAADVSGKKFVGVLQLNGKNLIHIGVGQTIDSDLYDEENNIVRGTVSIIAKVKNALLVDVVLASARKIHTGMIYDAVPKGAWRWNTYGKIRVRHVCN